MYRQLNKYGMAAAFGIGTILFLLGMLMGTKEAASNVWLVSSYILLVIAGLTALGLPLYFGLKDPKTLKGTGISLSVLGIGFWIFHASADNTLLPEFIAQGVTQGEVQFSSAIISFTIGMLVVAGIALVATEVYNMVKK